MTRVSVCILAASIAASTAAASAPPPLTNQLDPEWSTVTQYPPLHSNDVALKTATATDGSIYFLGTLGSHLALLRTSPTGDTLWTVRLSGMTPLGFDLLDSSYIAIIARTTLLPEPDDDYVTLLYTADGHLQWTSYYEDDAVYPELIATSALEYVAIAGRIIDSTGHSDIVVTTYDIAGNPMWTTSHDSPDVDDDLAPASMSCDAFGNVLVAGQGYPSGGCITLKFDMSGSVVWARSESSLLRGDVMTVDPNGNATVGSNAGSTTAVVRYTPGGTRTWITPIPGINPAGLVQDDEGNVYVATRSAMSSPAWNAVKLDVYGGLLWHTSINGPPGAANYPFSVALSQGALYVAGQWSDPKEHCMLSRLSIDGWEDWTILFDGPGSGSDFPARPALSPSLDGVTLFSAESTPEGDRDWSIRTVAPNGVQARSLSFAGMKAPQAVATSATIGSNGNVFLAGYVESAGGSEDVAVAAYGTTGAILWSARSPGLGYLGGWPRIAADEYGGIYVSSSLRIASPDIGVAKYNLAGNLQWSASYDGPAHKDDYAAASVVTPLGSLYVTGTSVGNMWDYDMTTWKYSTLGALQWVRRYESPACPSTNRHDNGVAICLTGDSGVVVTGYGNNGDTGPCTRGIVTIKYSPSGNTQWMARYDEPGVSMQPLAVASNGAGVFVFAIDNYAVGALVSYTHTGVLTGVTPVPPSGLPGGLYGGDLSLGDDGSIYVCTTEYDSIGSRWLIASFDRLGTERWRSLHFDNPGFESTATAICIGPGGRIHIAGESAGDIATVCLDEAGTPQYESTYDGGHRDYSTDLVAGHDGVFVVGSVGLPTGSAHAVLKYFNPQLLDAARHATDYGLRVTTNDRGSVVRVEFSAVREETVRMQFYDVQGRVIAREAGRFYAPGQHAVELDSRTWAPGVVFLRWTADERYSVTRKVVVLR